LSSVLFVNLTDAIKMMMMICHSSDSNNKFNIPDRNTAGCQFLVAQNVQPSFITEESWK
jgi:hypothetical protein